MGKAIDRLSAISVHWDQTRHVGHTTAMMNDDSVDSLVSKPPSVAIAVLVTGHPDKGNDRIFIIVHRGGKERVRQYKRPVKNGMTYNQIVIHLLKKRTEEVRVLMRENLSRPVFG